MQLQMLKDSAEYGELVEGVFSKVEFSSFRNSPHLLWMKRGATNLRDSINHLLKIESLTQKEREFLLEVQKIVTFGLSKYIVKIEQKKATQILALSMDAIIERDFVVKEVILNESDYSDFQEALYLLEANAKLIELVKQKLLKSGANKDDFLNIQEVSKSLVKTYLFLAGEIKKEFLLDSMDNVREVWRHYYPLNKLLAE